MRSVATRTTAPANPATITVGYVGDFLTAALPLAQGLPEGTHLVPLPTAARGDLDRLDAASAPSILIVDTDAAGFGGLATLKALSTRLPSTRIIVLMTEPAIYFLRKALQSGAWDFILRGAGTAEVERVCGAAARDLRACARRQERERHRVRIREWRERLRAAPSSTLREWIRRARPAAA